MSREIKFRAWSEKANHFAEAGYNYLRLDGKAFATAKFSVLLGTDEIEEVSEEEIIEDGITIEQYTGLKDKNGKEIYEGDIIEEEIDFNSKMIDGTFKYKVYWDDTTLSWGLEPIGPESIHSDLWECNQSIKVIGNVHED